MAGGDRVSRVETCPPHRWRIAEPNGPLSDAYCRYCGEHRMMPNAEGESGMLRMGIRPPAANLINERSTAATLAKAETVRANGWQRIRDAERASEGRE